MGKGWTEEWQGLGCREGEGKVGCAKACGQTFELARAGLGSSGGGGDTSTKLSEDCPRSIDAPRALPKVPEEPRDRQGPGWD